MSYKTPDLGYKYNALEPTIDEATMKVHHDKHHTGYTAKLNAAVEGTPLEGKDPVEILKDLANVPDKLQTAVRNNGGGHVNHSLFWQVMTPGGSKKPKGQLAEAIDEDLGGYEAFRKVFSQSAATRFGSGWAWLVLSRGKLDVYSTSNQDSPYSRGDIPVLGLDVWEHAYYLKYQNRRVEYVENFFSVINWDKVEDNYRKALD